jgi:UDP-N-acetylmuramoylalanine--D-glutamate ligase
MELKGKKVAVLGLLNDGLDMIKALVKSGSIVTGFGTGTELEQKQVERQLKNNPCTLIWDEIPELDSFDLVVVTPGSGKYKEAYEQARSKGISVLSDLDLALKFMKGAIIGVTGTNGKSTTVTIIEQMLKAGGYKVAVCGGDFSKWGGPLSDRRSYDYHILELTSRRLELSSTFHPHIAVLLNLFPTHFDRHPGGYPAYIDAKAKIFELQTEKDFLVHDADAGNVRELIRKKSAKSTSVMFSFWGAVTPPSVYREKEGLIWEGPHQENEVISLRKMKNRTPTHLINVMAALAVACLCKVKIPAIQKVIDSFSGLPSRIERIRKIDGVTFVDDSVASNVGATSWALNSFTRPIIWIAGGSFTEDAALENLASVARGKVKLIIVLGAQKREFSKIWAPIAPIIEAEDLQEAVKIANQNAEQKDYVLFSPACPPDFVTQKPGKVRGQDFKTIVKNLPEVARVVRPKAGFTRI